MQYTVDAGDIIAAIALIFSAYATWKTFRFNERQKSLIDSQEKLNDLLFEKEIGEVENDKKADLGTKFIKLGSSKYRLKIWNKGKAAARNVRIEFPEGGDAFIKSDVDGKFPLETLEKQQSVELIAAVHMGTKSKQIVRLIWDDKSQDNNEKLSYPTL